MFSVNIEGKDEKLTIAPLEVRLEPKLEAAIARLLTEVADFLAWVRRK